MKIIVLIDWFLPGNKAGGPVKSIYALIKALSNKINFYVITLNTDISSDQQYKIAPNEWTTYENIQVFYFSKNNFSFKKLTQVIDQINPQLIYINSFWSFKFSILPILLKKFNLLQYPILLSPRGMLVSGALSVKSFKKKIFLFLSKTFSLHHTIILHSTSEEETKSIQNIFPKSKIFTIPNLYHVQYIQKEIPKPPNQLKLFFLSRITPIKNLDFAIKALLQTPVNQQTSIKFDIYGNDEDEEYFKYCKTLIEKMPPQIIIQYKGNVSYDEVGQIIPQYHALLLPTKNENFGHTIVETLICERPVIISNQTPWSDINSYNAGWALELNENEFSKKIYELLMMDNEAFQNICHQAKNYIHQKLNIDIIKNEYLKMFEYAANIS